jgi:DNA-binding transcriptional LysR family regulator
MLDLRRLRLLRELQARGTLTAVADALSYSPSSVSQQLSELEREAGVALLERVGRGVRLTDAANVLVEHAGALLARMEQAEADMAASAGAVVGTVRIASFQTAAVGLLPAALTTIAAAYPALRVEVVHAETGPALRGLALGQVDLVVGIEYDHVPEPRDPGIARERLLGERMLLALPPGHRRGRGTRAVALADLAGEAWGAGTVGGHAALVTRACNLLGGFQPDLRHHADDLLVLRALVAAGHAVTFLPELLAARGGDAIALRRVAEADLRREVFLAVRHGALARPALAVARDAIRGAARGLTGRHAPAAR